MLSDFLSFKLRHTSYLIDKGSLYTKTVCLRTVSIWLRDNNYYHVFFRVNVEYYTLESNETIYQARKQVNTQLEFLISGQRT